jgi:hypothetical protein
MVLSITTPLVPPLAASVAVVPAGSVPPRVVGIEKDMRHPALLGQFTGLELEPGDSTLRNIQSLLLLNTSVTGEQVVFAVASASTLVPLAAMALDVIRT